MTGLAYAAGWLLIAVLCVLVLAGILRPPSRAAPARSRGARPARAAPTAAAAPGHVPGTTLSTAATRPTSPVPPVAVERAESAGSALPPSPAALSPVDADRTGLLLLGADPQAVSLAREAGARHLGWLPGARTAHAAPAGGGPAVALGSARVTVLGTVGSAGARAALTDCATAGVPLLLPAQVTAPPRPPLAALGLSKAARAARGRTS